MQTLNTFASDYDEIDFYVVSFNEDAATVSDYIAEHNYQGMIPAQPVGNMLADLEVTRQSSFMSLNAHGRILHRQTMGNAGEWPAYLDRLVTDPLAVPSQQEGQQQKEQRQMDMQLPS
ncbi:MAG: hypothetical protein F4X64_03770 [Chloroflexi bacterium]|nr:hypothetical protein [Chloroflexota bacterium]